MNKAGYMGDCVCTKYILASTKVTFHWNDDGKCVLAEVGRESGESYYGSNELYLLTDKNVSYLIPTTGKAGNVHGLSWMPKSTTFCVIYGSFPDIISQAYNHNGDVVASYSRAARNCIGYNAQGSLLALGGIKSINSGTIEIWNVSSGKMITKVSDPDTNCFMWLPDGQHFITATHAPGLVTNNHITVWHYTGKKVRVFKFKGRLGVTNAAYNPHLFKDSSKEDLLLGIATFNRNLVENFTVQVQGNFIMSEQSIYVPKKLRENGNTSYSKSPKYVVNKYNTNSRFNSMTGVMNKFNNNNPPKPTVEETKVEYYSKRIKRIEKKIAKIEKTKQSIKDGKEVEENQKEQLLLEEEYLAKREKLKMALEQAIKLEV